jgi:5'-3' exonuclease
VENLYDQILNNGMEAESLKPSLRSKLIQSQKNVFFSKQLVEIKKDVSVDFDPKKCRWGLFDREKAKENLQKFGFRSLAEKIPETGAKKQIGENFKLW